MLAIWFTLTHEPLKRSVFDGEIPQTDPRVISFNMVKADLPNQEWVGLIIEAKRRFSARSLGVGEDAH